MYLIYFNDVLVNFHS